MAIVVEGRRFACQSCIRGHRTALCQHADRPLIPLARRGRPTKRTHANSHHKTHTHMDHDISKDRVVLHARSSTNSHHHNHHKHTDHDNMNNEMNKEMDMLDLHAHSAVTSHDFDLHTHSTVTNNQIITLDLDAHSTVTNNQIITLDLEDTHSAVNVRPSNILFFPTQHHATQPPDHAFNTHYLPSPSVLNPLHRSPVLHTTTNTVSSPLSSEPSTIFDPLRTHAPFQSLLSAAQCCENLGCCEEGASCCTDDQGISTCQCPGASAPRAFQEADRLLMEQLEIVQKAGSGATTPDEQACLCPTSKACCTGKKTSCSNTSGGCRTDEKKSCHSDAAVGCHETKTESCCSKNTSLQGCCKTEESKSCCSENIKNTSPQGCCTTASCCSKNTQGNSTSSCCSQEEQSGCNTSSQRPQTSVCECGCDKFKSACRDCVQDLCENTLSSLQPFV